jgi:hypothetical protein
VLLYCRFQSGGANRVGMLCRMHRRERLALLVPTSSEAASEVKLSSSILGFLGWVGFAWDPRPLALQAPQLQASLSIPPASSPGPGAFCILADAATGGSVGTRAAGHAAARAYGRVWQDACCCLAPPGAP